MMQLLANHDYCIVPSSALRNIALHCCDGPERTLLSRAFDSHESEVHEIIVSI